MPNSEFYLQIDEHQAAIERIMRARPDRIEWESMQCNPAAINILLETIDSNDEIDLEELCRIPGVFSKLLDKVDFCAIPDYDNVWGQISTLPEAIPFLEANPDKIRFRELCSNPSAMHLIEANKDKIDNSYLSENPAAVPFLREHPEFIDWRSLSRNPAAIDLVEANLDKVDIVWIYSWPIIMTRLECQGIKFWETLTHESRIFKMLKRLLATDTKRNGVIWLLFHPLTARLVTTEDLLEAEQNEGQQTLFERASDLPYAIHLIKENLDKVSRKLLSRNPAAISLLEQNPDLIDWKELSGNCMAMPLIVKNLDKIDKSVLSRNPAAIFLLEQNPDLIDFDSLGDNYWEYRTYPFDYNFVSSHRRELRPVHSVVSVINREHQRQKAAALGFPDDIAGFISRY